MTEVTAGRQGSRARLELRIFLLTLIGILLVMATLNVVVNPYGYYPNRLFQPLTWSSRQTKAALMSHGPAAEALIIGSSRTMSLSPAELERLTGLRAFNASVDSARTEDLLAIVQNAIHDLHWPLREIVLGLDVEAFHDGIPPDVRLSTTPAFRRWLPWTQRQQVIASALKDLVSLSQAQQSVRSVLLHLKGMPTPLDVFQANGWNDIADWENKFRRGLVHTNIEASLVEYDGRYLGFQTIDVDRARFLEELLTLAESKRIRVRAFLTPLHPTVIERLRRNRNFDRLRAEAVEALQRLTNERREMSFHDYTEVQSFGGAVDLFVDGAHVRRENADRLLTALYRD